MAAITVVFAGTLYLYALNWRPSDADYDLQGIDVSAANGSIDWAAVQAAGAKFGYIAATSGTDRDAAFEDNWRGAAAAGMRRGAVHVWSLCRGADEQANNFNTTVPKDPAALPSAVSLDFAAGCDTRPDRETLVAALSRYLAVVEANTRRPVILFVSRAFDSRYHITEAIDRPVWSAQNFFAPDYAARPWRMWRASDMRRIDGVSEPVNWDVVAK
ncbi:MAG: glycosyl hydrolase [Sphingomonas sp.]|nr:glycosyl hydrolase [Sphingomonas sp.]